ncbi:MAG TPA: vitamin K epoxide reductase family protein, partial [Chthonomonadales bacterium]|nr:vitamin K epoxide reductase family protein [Chthonomonadales bacterium]
MKNERVEQQTPDRLPQDSTGLMKRFITNYITLGLAVIGGLDAILLTVEHYQPTINLPCGGVNGGCHGVLHSPYAQVGPIPTSLFGFAMYAAVIFLCLKRRKSLLEMRRSEAEANSLELQSGGEDGPDPAAVATSEKRLREAKKASAVLDWSIWGIALAAIVTSWWLQYTSLFKMQAFCQYCFASAGAVTLIFLLSTYDVFVASRKLNGEQKLLAWVVGFILGLLALMYSGPLIGVIIQISQGSVAYQPPSLRSILIPPDPHTKGPADAPYTIVEFADYQCPACKDGVGATEAVLHNYPGKIRLIFRNYPLQMH